jgi:hypothetical protein
MIARRALHLTCETAEVHIVKSRNNVEVVARTIGERICRNESMSEAATVQWVEQHWRCVAAELEAGLIDEQGVRLTDWTLDRGLAALRDWERRHPEL